jgi:hypothetical protein
MQVCLGVNHETQQDVRDLREIQQDWTEVLARLVRMEDALAAMVSQAAAAQQLQNQMTEALRVGALDVARMQHDTHTQTLLDTLKALSVVVQSQRDSQRNFMATVNSDSVEPSPRLQSLSSNSSSDHSVSACSFESDDDFADWFA